MVGLRYQEANVRGAVALHTGTYVQENYAAEPELFRFIYEASAGFSPLNKVWVDAGIFPSHIGFESAISADNWTLTRSLMAENSPYYEAGTRVSYQPNTKWSFTGLVLNGWQVIYETDKYKAVGTQVQWQPGKRWLLNSSLYAGRESRDSLSRVNTRLFHNFFVRYLPEKGIQWALVADVGLQGRGNAGRGTWHTAALIARYPFNPHWAVAGRAEYYYDPNGFVVTAGPGDSFDANAVSLNIDYAPASRVLCRLEGRHLGWNRLIYQVGNTQTILTTSISIRL